MAKSDPVTVFVNAGNEIWIPKSQIEDDFDWDSFERGDILDLDIPEWLAEDKGLW